MLQFWQFKSFLSLNKPRAVLEIGVCRNDKKSSTYCFLDNKNDETIYVGIDIVDKRFLNNPNKNIHTIKNRSCNYDENVEEHSITLGSSTVLETGKALSTSYSGMSDSISDFDIKKSNLDS